jgi:hypothetical protein
MWGGHSLQLDPLCLCLATDVSQIPKTDGCFGFVASLRALLLLWVLLLFCLAPSIQIPRFGYLGNL